VLYPIPENRVSVGVALKNGILAILEKYSNVEAFQFYEIKESNYFQDIQKKTTLYSIFNRLAPEMKVFPCCRVLVIVLKRAT